MKTTTQRILKEIENTMSSFSAKIYEAVIFYCARILEIIVTDIITNKYKMECKNVFSGLKIFEEFNLLDRNIIFFSHNLRRSGNDVRHINKEINKGDAEICLIFLYHLIYYFEVNKISNYKIDINKLKNIIFDNKATELKTIIEVITSVELFDASFKKFLTEEKKSIFFNTTVIISFYAEKLIDAKLNEEAIQIIEKAFINKKNKFDVRLNQLYGLAFKSIGKIDKAISVLEKINQYDEETSGILAAAYKERWKLRSASKDLEKSYSLYKDAFRSSGNVYSGINYATMALLTDKFFESRKIAEEIITLIERRKEHGIDIEKLGYWDLVTYAEALTLTGDLYSSRRIYGIAFNNIDKTNIRMKESTINQLSIILKKIFNDRIDVNKFISRQNNFNEDSIFIGVTGHRNIKNKDVIEKSIIKIIENLGENSKKEFVLVTSLAEGSDRLVPLIFNNYFKNNIPLIVYIPLDINNYLKDFSTASSKEEFYNLLVNAERIFFPDMKKKNREEYYLYAGIRMCEKSDIIIAIWDGLPARGKGGTGDIVEYALKNRKKVIIVNSETGETKI